MILISRLSIGGACNNTFYEERKHYVYASLMGIRRAHWSFTVPIISVVDIGGGPVSMLLKTHGYTRATVLDPLPYPEWVRTRYEAVGISWVQAPGESASRVLLYERGEDRYDEAWSYNVAQHVTDPVSYYHQARLVARRVRVFEWVDIPPHEGHPHMLTANMLDEVLGTHGTVHDLSHGGCFGRAYAAIADGV